MPDPINDYASVPSLSESVRLRAVHGALMSAKRRNATPAEALEFIDMLGLSDVASEIVGRPLVAAQMPTTARRDTIGRVRPALAQPDADGIPPGQHGHNGRCASGDHAWVEENIRPATDANPGARCRPCIARTKRGGSSKAAEGPILCKCPGKKHVLSVEDSESTYVDPRGQRQCRVGIERRRQAQAVTDDTLKEGERWCGCTPERHILTPYPSETTYVNPSGGRSCRVGRRRSDEARSVAARKRRAG